MRVAIVCGLINVEMKRNELGWSVFIRFWLVLIVCLGSFQIEG